MTRSIVRIAAFLLLLISAPRPASACSAPPCAVPRLLAGADIVVPVNAPDLAVLGESVSVELFDVSGATRAAVEVSVIAARLVPATPLIEGRVYELELTSECFGGEESGRATITVGPPAELPTVLGSLPALAETSMGTVPVPANASCYQAADAHYADVEVVLDPATSPWADLLVFETYVDGERYAPTGTYSSQTDGSMGYGEDPAGSWRGRGRDRIYTLCGSLPEDAVYEEGIAAGTHTVTVVASIPGTDLALETNASSFTLSCAMTPPASQPPCPETYDPNYESECPASRYDSSSTGCSVGGQRSGASGIMIALFGFGLVVVGRRYGR